jgi:hypothetical protein
VGQTARGSPPTSRPHDKFQFSLVYARYFFDELDAQIIAFAQRLPDNIALSYSPEEERAEMPQCGTISMP